MEEEELEYELQKEIDGISAKHTGSYDEIEKEIEIVRNLHLNREIR